MPDSPRAHDAACVVVRVPRLHACPKPGWWKRRKLDLGEGSVWRCPCGQQWQWNENWAGALWVRV